MTIDAPPIPRSRAPQLENVQYLRGIAALMVVFHHTLTGAPARPALLATTTVFATGVEIFFVISGFVIYLSQGEKTDIRNFALHRFIRIVPLYWLFTVAFPRKSG